MNIDINKKYIDEDGNTVYILSINYSTELFPVLVFNIGTNSIYRVADKGYKYISHMNTYSPHIVPTGDVSEQERVDVLTKAVELATTCLFEQNIKNIIKENTNV